MEHVSDKQRFWDVAPAAPNIFWYVRNTPALQGHKLEFEYAMVDEASNRAVAKFVCLSCAKCRNAVVWVSALTQLDGTWLMKHSFGSMG